MKLLEGIIHVTGEHDVGKTTFALEAGASPDKICFFDDDVKGRATVNEIKESVGFGAYYDLVEIGRRKTELAYHEAVLTIINAIKPGQFDSIIWDTWSHFAATCHPFVVAHPSQFRASWNAMGKIKGAQQWQEARRYEAGLLNYMSTLARQVIVITHLKDVYINDAKVPDKFAPDASKTLERIPRFRLWLRQNPSGRPVPIGLVLKRLDKKVLEDGRIRTVAVLPRKLSPDAGENSLWDTIWRYYEDPIGNASPMPDEVPTEYELGILDGTLTKDQAVLFREMIAHGLVGRDEGEIEVKDDGEETQEEKARRMIEEGVAPEEIAAQLGVPMPLIKKWMGV